MRVMNGSSSTETAAFPSTIITGVCRGTLESTAAQGARVRKHLQRAGLACCIQNVGMVYHSGKTRAAEQEDARSLQPWAACL